MMPRSRHPARSKSPRSFLTPRETALVEEAIKKAEAGTSAQIKFVVARHCWGSIRDKARRTFAKLGLQRTAHRNCVLILLVTANQEFMIYGDRGIHEKAGQETWDKVRDHMAGRFREDAFAEGICDGIELIGQRLAAYFPPEPGGRNEVPDAVDYQE